MPESYFQLSVKNQASAIDAASEASGRAPHLLEKDIWVVWALSTLFRSELRAHLVFKGGTALSKAHKVITRFSEDVDLTYDIRALVPELVRSAPSGINAIPLSRSQQKKWSDEIRGELLPAWLRNHAHPIIQTGLEGMKHVSSRVTEDCIFIDYEPVTPASGYALPSVKLEFGARSSGEPSFDLMIRCWIPCFRLAGPHGHTQQARTPLPSRIGRGLYSSFRAEKMPRSSRSCSLPGGQISRILFTTRNAPSTSLPRPWP